MWDVGGVFEVGEVIDADGTPAWLAQTATDAGISPDEARRLMATVDPHGITVTGGMDETDLRAGYQRVLGLTDEGADRFMTHLWHWYCGELDDELFAYAIGLAPTYRLGIVSNSIDGARREEEQRYRFSRWFDPIVYSHEIGLAKPAPAVWEHLCRALDLERGQVLFIDDSRANVEAAQAYGIRSVLHTCTPATIEAVERALGQYNRSA